MKTLIAALALFAPLAASAAPDLDCRDVHAGPDHGYYAAVKELTTAVVTMETFAGRQPVATMKCTMPHRMESARVLAICFDETSGDDWMLTIKTGPNGPTSAILEKNGGRGDRIAATLDCRAR